MFYKRPSLRRGGMPTGIDTLSPRVQAQSGFFGQTPFRPMPSIMGDFGRYNVGMSGGQLPFQERMMKSFPMDASEMGVASVVRPKQETKKDTINFIQDYGEGSDTSKLLEGYENWEDVPLFIKNLPFSKGIFEARQEEKIKEIKQAEKERRESFERPNMADIAGKVIPEKKNQEVDKSKDTQVGGEVVEDSFDSEFDKQMKRLEKYLGSTNRETKGRLAIALSDAIGTPGSIADKASVLNKSLLGILGERKKDKRELAKLAFAAATELQGKRIEAGKKGFSERRFDEYAALASKTDRTPAEEKRFQILKDGLGIQSGLTGPSATAAGKIANEVNDLIIDLQTAADNEKPELQSKIIGGINQLLLIQGVTKDNIGGIVGFDVSAYLADGGRVNKAMGGGASETPAEPVATNLTFEQLRTRLPKEITDDIVRLVATSEEALQDFAYIRTQGDVEKFNVKYGVNLVLPQETA